MLGTQEEGPQMRPFFFAAFPAENYCSATIETVMVATTSECNATST
jgi:hypothetical protein